MYLFLSQAPGPSFCLSILRDLTALCHIARLTRPLVATKGDFELPDRQVVAEGTDTSGFTHNGVESRNDGAQYVKSTCSGMTCDGQSILSGGAVAKGCACFQMRHRKGSVLVSFFVTIVKADGTSFTAEYCSKSFCRTFIFNGDLPNGIRASHLEEFVVDERINNAANAVFDLVNSTGGWTISGWATKRGEVQDQAVDQPGNGLPYNAPRVLIEAGNLNYHITRMVPTRPEDIDLDVLEGLKVTMLPLT